MNKIWFGVVLASITIVGLAAYSNTLNSPPIYDDHRFEVNQQLLERKTTLAEVFQSRSLTVETFKINYRLSGLKNTGWHVFNLLIHLAAAIAAFFLVYQLSLQVWPRRFYGSGSLRITNHLFGGALASLLFVAHPLTTQSVTYLYQRHTSLAGLLYVLALLLYVLFRQGGKQHVWWAGASLIATVLAMHAKEYAITIPIAIVLLEAIFFSQTWTRFRSRAWKMTPWLVTLAILPFYQLGGTALIQGEIGWRDLPGRLTPTAINYSLAEHVYAEKGELSRGEYFLTEINVVRTYLRLLVWPANQSLDYDYPWSHSLWEVTTLLSLGLHLGLLALALWLMIRGYRLAAFGIYFFYITLLLESSVFPISAEVIAEQRTYLPTLAFAMVTASLFNWLLEKFQDAELWEGITGSRIIMVAAILITLALAGMTYNRNKLWQNEIVMWEDVVNKAPNWARPHKNLVKLYLNENPARAEEHAKRAIELDPTDLGAHTNLGTVYIKQGKLTLAIKENQQEIANNPEYVYSYSNLGAIYHQLGRLDEASAQFIKALAIGPNSVPVLHNLALVYLDQGKNDEAARLVQMIENLNQSTEQEPSNLRLPR